MIKEGKGYIIEEILEKPSEKRTIDERRFFAWHLKYKMSFFKQFPLD